MFATLKNAWHMPELRKKLLYTLLIIVLFRLGSTVPVPFLDVETLKTLMGAAAESGNNILAYMNAISGGALSNGSIFALSIGPYITSSIVIQLLTVAIPALERLQKEGEEGRKRIQKISRYTTIALALLQGYAYYTILRNRYMVVTYTSGFEGIFAACVIIGTFIGGSMLLVYMGERIDEKGIGNGISMILFAGIVSRGFGVVTMFWGLLKRAQAGEPSFYATVPLVIVLFLVLIVSIVIMTNAERRIPVQYAKRVVGRKMYGGQSSFMPIKVNLSGVMPIIFASSLLAIPGTILMLVRSIEEGSFWYKVLSAVNPGGWLYAGFYFLLILAFNYFYVAIQYNPIEMANQLRNNSGTIPGIRPGRPTSDFISRVISKITLIGGLFLALVATLPMGVGPLTGINISLGGTSIIIVVGVALDTFRQLESQMMMRHYKGFLE